MVKKNIVMSIGLSTVALTMGATNAYANESGIVTTDVLNVRSAPGTSNSIIGKLYRGNTVDILDSSNGWYKVKLSNGTTGWASNDYIKIGGSESGSGEESISGYGTVTADALNVRSGAGTSHSIVGKLYRNNSVELIAKSNGWYKVKLSSGKIGWASADYISLGGSGGNSGGSGEESVSGYGTVTTSALNVRSGAGTSYSIVGKLYKNNSVELIAKSNGWYKVKLSNGQVGWASADYISLGGSGGNSGGSGEESVSGYGTVTASSLNVRSGAGTSYSVIATLQRNQTVELIAKSNGWYKVKLSSGKIGWASSDYISLGGNPGGGDENEKPSTNAREAVVNLAKQQLGKPYVWGAEGPSSFDCSGLTYYVYKNAAGVNLPRTSREQSGYGTTVSRSNLQPGDLIFSSTDGSGSVSHVGIYIGNGEMIHAPKPGDVVKRTNINTSYWNGVYLWAKRVL
ncbi:C40 family peptidase [Romboutsia lituseburensis]|uniref:Cell wall-associated hydrolase, NlpC family n=1 Tax=Romboutsia lituseburensis DSM 797 TaxID=1121325 RepID=A0A1G9N3F3_9FIRM|nr:SH3 domain-containing protein [Romboutsia lituseburensis]SDL81052.1 Cell wall-associated hydrolase, NlpC family [Romboutsia lituseburensis DSM 797]